MLLDCGCCGWKRGGGGALGVVRRGVGWKRGHAELWLWWVGLFRGYCGRVLVVLWWQGHRRVCGVLFLSCDCWLWECGGGGCDLGVWWCAAERLEWLCCAGLLCGYCRWRCFFDMGGVHDAFGGVFVRVGGFGWGVVLV